MKTTEHTTNANADDTAEGADPAKPDTKRRKKTEPDQRLGGGSQTGDGRDLPAVTQFDFRGRTVGSVVKDGQPWFIARDVCDVLEHTDASKAVSRLDDDEKGETIIRTLGGPQVMKIVNESGLYSLVFTSTKPEAKAFRRWVTGEVLPAIRQTGRYEARRMAGAQWVQLDFPATGRFIVTMTADGPHVQETSYAAVLDEMAAINGTVLAHAMGLIACYWHMAQQLQCWTIDPAHGFTLERLKKAIYEGERLGRRYLEVWKGDRETGDAVKH